MKKREMGIRALSEAICSKYPYTELKSLQSIIRIKIVETFHENVILDSGFKKGVALCWYKEYNPWNKRLVFIELRQVLSLIELANSISWTVAPVNAKFNISQLYPHIKDSDNSTS